MNIDWSKAPEGATHFISTSAAKYWFKKVGDNFYAYNGTGWNANHANPSGVSMREMFEIPRPKPTENPVDQPKTLTQAVFNGLSSEYRWAAVDRDGDCFVFGVIPEELDGYGWGCEHGTPSHYIGENFDATDWENSLIEREESITDVARSIEAARQVEATLAERQNQYGDFKDVAHLSQGLQSLLSVGNFSDTQQEAIQMICSKLARLACGDADHVDSWHDIAGYATLVVKDLESGK
jgi:hypothetical protein